ncbi:MAG: Arc family DNA-binding protein [Ignavibacteria bacterium]|nr:Arc family DNA-binding protein [Ignavibacteria bacterium]
MADKKKFLLRIDENIYASLEKWAADDFRSINAQIEFLLKEALRKSGRINIGNNSSDNTKTDSNNNSDREN